jgi:hypothetical protein
MKVHNLTRCAVPFDAAFLERRMQQHEELRENMAIELAQEIIESAPFLAKALNELEVRTGKGPQKVVRLQA